jgi:guanylate kinase
VSRPTFPVILAAPSGSGKTTIARALLARRPDTGFSVTCTTRPPRPAEQDGVDYFFLAPTEFEERVARGDFAEHALVHGNRYGTLRSEIRRLLDSGRHAIMTIDVQGARAFVRAFPETVLVFVLPPSGAELVARLDGRGTEDAEKLRTRLRGALEELEAIDEYEYVVVNDEVERAVAEVSSIIDAEMARRVRQQELAARTAALAADLRRAIGT